MRKVMKILIWVVVAAIFIGTFIYLFVNSQSHEKVYQLVSPSSESIERTTVLTGKIEPRDEIDIKPQISGIISEISVEPGDVVKAGDVIAKIKVIPDEQQLSSAQNRVNVARLTLEQSKLEYDRTKQLYDKKFVSREEYEQSLNAYEKAREEVSSANDALAIVRDGISSLRASESNTLVKATIDGLILEVPVKVGSSVIQANTMNDGTTIATIADMNDLIFKGKIDETEVGLLHTGMPMKISIGALPDLSPEASIEYIAPKGTEDNGSNTFEIKAAISVPASAGLRAGYSANAAVMLDKADGAMTIPESVIEWAGDSTFVYCLTDSVPAQKFERRYVKTGISDGINIQVIEGLDKNALLRGDEIKK
ncbi:MAG: efflux RND transporter periplasmic adaptor subunit [Pseudoflavonifractor sp.]|nr:efflux RND transporter periplasmic adaptor subunit [Pseudoflavonifractor sp.]